MKFVISVVVALIAGWLAYICLNKTRFYKVRLISGPVEGEDVNFIGGKAGIIATVIIALLCLVCTYRLFGHTASVIDQIKMEVIMLCLAGAGCVDYREHRIPNFFPAIMAASGVILIAAGALAGLEGIKYNIISSCAAAIITVIILLLARVLTKNGIGMGDIKILGALGIIGGLEPLCVTMVCAIVLCAIASIAAMILKKKTVKDGMPFGPFIFIGFMILASIYKI